MALCQKGLELLASLPNTYDTRRERAFIHLNIGLATNEKLDIKSALETSLSLFKELNDTWGVSNVLERLGHPDLELADLNTIEENLELGLSLRNGLGDQRGQIRMLIHLSQLYRYRGAFNKSERRAQEALEISTRLNDRVSIAYSLMNLGFALSHLERFEETRSTLNKSIDIYLDLGNQFNLQNAYYMLGLNEIIGFGNLEKGEFYLTRSQTLARDLGYASGLLVTRYAFATINIAKERFQEAKKQFHELLQESTDLRSNLINGMILSDLAFVEYRLNKIQVARQHALKALLLARSSQNFIASQHALIIIAILLSESGNIELAIELDTLIREQHPSINSSWYFTFLRHSFTKRLDTLSSQVVETARQRGLRLDRWQAVESLTNELSRMGWEKEGMLEETRNGQTKRPLPNNLPTQPTPFLGRQQESNTLTSYLANPDKRLITILGAGGMGKTRLALAVAEQQLTLGRGGFETHPYEHGIYFVPLAPLSDADQIVPTLADALDFPLETGSEQRRTAKQQVLDYLRQKEMLLVFDNFEHLLGGVDLVADILQTAPKVKLLATSRERLHLHQEQLFALQGLDAPQVAASDDFAEFTAVRLFLQSAQRVKHDFQLRSEDQQWLVRICHLVGGMPLAVELAAGWVEVLTVAEIAQEIQRDLDLLETETHNIPARQRSIRAVFDGSWKRLSLAEQAALTQFSIFRGGFTRQAAQTIVGASLRTLGKLANKSLLQFDQARERYFVHELLRQYAAERLAKNETQEGAVREAHSRYYLNALAEREVKLKGREQQTALAEIEADIENVRIAWRWGVEQGDVAGLAGAMDTLGYFLERQARFQDGIAFYVSLKNMIALTKKDTHFSVGANSSLWAAVFYNKTGELNKATTLLDTAFKQSELLESEPKKDNLLALCWLREGQFAIRRKNETAREAFANSLACFEQLGYRWGNSSSQLRFRGHLLVCRRLCSSTYCARNLLENFSRVRRSPWISQDNSPTKYGSETSRRLDGCSFLCKS